MKKLFTSVCLLAAVVLVVPVFAQATTDELSKKDREYYLIYLDEDAKMDHLDANPKNVVKQDLRVDDTNRFMYIWENTYSAPTPAGSSYYDGFNGYLNLQVGNIGWSGAGLAISKTLTPNYFIDLTGLTRDHVFHIAMKSTATNPHLLFLWGGIGLEGAVCIGGTPFVDAGKTHQPVANFERDGKWHLVEVPMSKFMDAGFRCPEPFNDGNYFSFLSGNASGAIFSMDAIFIYKNLDGTGINDSYEDAKFDIIITNNVVTFVGVDISQSIQLFDLTGKLVKTLNEPIVGVDELAQGVYVAKAGTATAKFIIK